MSGTQSNVTGKQIYPLIPSIYRDQDATIGYPLLALCKVLDVEYGRLRADVESLYDQWFIETSSQWVVPYIGGLLGVTGIETSAANVPTQRARVANTTGYRARRGVAAILANACGDASGWPGVAVEYFQRIITSVNVGAIEVTGRTADSLRPATIDVSAPASLANLDLDGPFSAVSRTVSVDVSDQPRIRIPGATPQSYNLPSLGVFLWRTPALPIWGSDPGLAPRIGATYLTFHPLGLDTQILQLPLDRTSPWVAAKGENVPLQITRQLLAARTEMWRNPGASALPPLGFTIYAKGEPIGPAAIFVPAGTDDIGAHLESPRKAFKDEFGDLVDPPDLYAVVDPERGRFVVIHEGKVVPGSLVTLDWAWGQAGWIGGGAYDRNDTIVLPTAMTTTERWSRSAGAGSGTTTPPLLPETVIHLVSERHHRPGGGGNPPILARIGDPRHFLQARSAPSSGSTPPRDVLIRVLDSATYGPMPEFALDAGDVLTIQAIDGQRPTFRADQDGVSLSLRVTPPDGRATVLLSGLLLAGTIKVTGQLDLELLDMTVAVEAPPIEAPLVGASPARAAAVAWGEPMGVGVRLLDTGEPMLRLKRCVVGPLHLPQRTQVEIIQSIVDGRGGRAIGGVAQPFGPPISLDAVTVLGDVWVESLDEAVDVIVTGKVVTERIQRDLLQTTLFAIDLVTSDPDHLTVWSRPTKLPLAPFNSTRYPDPGYCQLRIDTSKKLLRGGTGDGELGAYHALATGQRLANLQPVITDYTPFGLAVGIYIMDQIVSPPQPRDAAVLAAQGERGPA
jgi:hypothetical protein